jgi:hypothetical protein
MYDKIDKIGMGFCLGALVVFLIMVLHWAPYKNKIVECESTLPRDQYCVLIAVPESEEE